MSDNTGTTLSLKDQLRAKIFSAENKAVKSELVDFFGVKIELRQPTLGDILNARENEDSQGAVIDTLVQNAYVPGTSERLFDDADAEQFKTMPFGADFLRVNKVIEALTEIDFLATSDDSKKTG